MTDGKILLISDFRKPALRNLMVCSILLLSSTGVAIASPITLSFEVNIRQIVAGSVDDPAGMDGASVFFTTTFADGAFWQNSGFGSVLAVADSHSFTISGASLAASNGTYSDPNSFLIESSPGFEFSFQSLPFTNNDPPEIILGSGHLFSLGFSLSPVSIKYQPGVGDFIDSSHFATSFNTFDSLMFDALTSSSPVQNFYEIANVVSAPSTSGGPTGGSSIPPVPAPPALWLFGTALVGLVGFVQRKKAA